VTDVEDYWGVKALASALLDSQLVGRVENDSI
jgi:hypothetical protein